MIRFVQVARVFALGLAWNSMAIGQESTEYIRDTCVKVRDGKAAEYSEYLRDSAKLAKVRVDSGVYGAYIIAQATYPTGRSARCDYHLVISWNKFPGEAPTPEQIDADMKKAGISMSRTARAAKAAELSYTVGADLMRGLASAGTGVVKNGYARVNYFKIKAGTQGDWLNLETTGWKPLAEAAAKDMGTSWSVYGLVMPGGADLPYNAITVDGYPSWEALGKGIPTRSIWNKVHPNQDMASYMEKVAAIADRPRIDVYKILDVIKK